MQLLPLNDGRVEKSLFHGCCRLGTPGGRIGTFQSRSFVAVVVSFRKVWVSIKFLSAKFGVTPPPPRKGPKMRKNCTNQYKILKIDTFSGGGKRDCMDKTILWTSYAKSPPERVPGDKFISLP